MTTRTRTARDRRRNSIVGNAIVGAVLLAFAVVAFVQMVSLYGQAERSARTQQDGVRAEVSIEGHEFVRHFARYSTNYDTLLQARFVRPQDGHTHTTVHIRGRTIDVSPGTTRTVLIDPRDPAYSEADGTSYRDDVDWAGRLGAGVVALLLLALVIWRTFRPGRSRRRPPRTGSPAVSLAKGPEKRAL